MKLGGIELKEGTFGGYEIINKPLSATSMPQELATAFPLVNAKLLGATYDPIWYVGRQLVNGINHMLICKEVRVTATQKPAIVAMVINVPAGKATTGEGASIVKIIEEAELSDELAAIFKAGTTNLVGVGYKPIAYVGKQVVRGMNYYFICEARPVVLNPNPYAVLLGINVFENQHSVVVIEPLDKITDAATKTLGYAFTW